MKIKRIAAFILIIALLALVSIIYPHLTGNSVSNSNTEYEREQAFVTKIVDGDTIHVNINNKEEVVRLLGINNKGV